MTPPANHAWPGAPYPLGATWDGQGVNFALWSERASAVELCLFDTDDTFLILLNASPTSTPRAASTLFFGRARRATP